VRTYFVSHVQIVYLTMTSEPNLVSLSFKLSEGEPWHNDKVVAL
jgi:hypothetical protein